jgi:hypothetical protein
VRLLKELDIPNDDGTDRVPSHNAIPVNGRQVALRLESAT